MADPTITILSQFYHKIQDYRNAIIIVVVWIISGYLSENPIVDVFNQIFRFFLYPINFVIYRTDFSVTTIPSVFLILIPLFFNKEDSFLHVGQPL